MNKLTWFWYIASNKKSRRKSQIGMEFGILFLDKWRNFLSFFFREINNSHEYPLLSKS